MPNEETEKITTLPAVNPLQMEWLNSIFSVGSFVVGRVFIANARDTSTNSHSLGRRFCSIENFEEKKMPHEAHD